MENTADTCVLYNGQCPICSREIDVYRRETQAAGLPLAFDDLHAADLARWGVSAEDARRRLHVIADGQVLSGMPAFVALWNALPRWRWLGRLVGLPGVRQIAALVYDHALAPMLYAMDVRRRRRAQTR
jgi:predicted DCC family thiol-disulfide oxidoreductase YuxK